MTKTLIIPDIHLKTYILEEAEKIIQTCHVEKIVFVGDYFDDWGYQYNSKLYKDTCQALLDFNKKYNCVFLLGNHDVPYITRNLHHYSTGFPEVINQINKTLQQLNVRLAYQQNGILITHAGATNAVPENYFEPLLFNRNTRQLLNQLDQGQDSILWLRPDNFLENHSGYSIQIVGHTPIKKPTWYKTLDQQSKMLVNDTWSTTQNGETYGNQSFVLIEDGKIKIIK